MARLYVLMREVRFLLRYQQAGPIGKLRMQIPRGYNRLPRSVRAVLREELQAALQDFGDVSRSHGLATAAFWTTAEFTGRCAGRTLNGVSTVLEVVNKKGPARPRRPQLRVAA